MHHYRVPVHRAEPGGNEAAEARNRQRRQKHARLLVHNRGGVELAVDHRIQGQCEVRFGAHSEQIAVALAETRGAHLEPLEGLVARMRHEGLVYIPGKG